LDPELSHWFGAVITLLTPEFALRLALFTASELILARLVSH